ncbi:ABC transporter ATP-binding protein [Austwickia chelonae]|uniref:ABC transporter ATP-binding protein n=1 Tax=Austwickia chelonae TaxID=100225 RepID=UPI000E27EE4B|nr:ABC transporter ATP-binding protein [Austwickia chelonae]
MTELAPPLLELKGLTVGYRLSRSDRRIILEDVNAAVLPGELVGLVGPNGAGKSTLLRSISGLQPVFAGAVRLCGEDSSALHRKQIATRLAAVLTDRFDPGRLKVRDVVALGRHPYSSITGRLDTRDRASIADSLDAVGAAHLAHTDIRELSDGQRQRVMVARALAQEPRILLLDEPTAFLDPPGRVSLLELVRRICTDRQIAAVVCTHDIESILTYSERIWVAGRDTKLVVGGPEDLARDGSLARPFATPGVRFDLTTLTFRPEVVGRPTAYVDGSGTAASLTTRCLLRAGYDVRSGTTRDNSGLLVSVSQDGMSWTISHPVHGQTDHDNLADVHSTASAWKRADFRGGKRVS